MAHSALTPAFPGAVPSDAPWGPPLFWRKKPGPHRTRRNRRTAGETTHLQRQISWIVGLVLERVLVVLKKSVEVCKEDSMAVYRAKTRSPGSHCCKPGCDIEYGEFTIVVEEEEKR